MALHRKLIEVTLCTLIGVTLGSTFECGLTDYCLCYQPNPTMYEFQCPPDSPSILIRTNEKDVELECLIDVDWDVQNLTTLNIDRINSLKIQMCSLPKLGLEDIMHKLGLNVTETVQFSFSTFGNTTITLKDLRGLIGLAILDLNYNNIERLEQNDFASLSGLIQIDLSNNRIKSLPSKLFETLPKLKSLNLSSNEIDAFPEDIFIGDFHIEELDLGGNPVGKSVASLKFPPSLKKLGLSVDQIKNVPEDFFNNLAQLEELDLSKNQITDLPEYIFQTLTKLKSINLEGNSLAQISKGLFQSQRNLETINLRRNGISFINIHAFQHNTNLKEIILASNNFKLTQNQASLGVSPFQANTKLERLDLSQNKITYISDDWVLSKIHLKMLDLSHNEIESLTLTDLMGVSSNLSINLSHNKIATVDFRMVNHLNPTTDNLQQRVVILDENPLQCDCLIYDFASYFDGTINPLIPITIKITADNLKCMGPEAHFNKPVTEIKSNTLTCVVKNCPNMCDCGFRPRDQALLIDCSYRNLTMVPVLLNDGNDFYNYTEINLEGNLLKKGPTKGMGYEIVNKMTLSQNNISTISWIPPQLQMLDISNNNIEHLDDNFLSVLSSSPRLANLSLGNNPWNCGCTALNLRSFMITHLISKRTIDADNIKCKTDKRLLIHLSVNDVCLTFSTLIVLCSLVLALMATAISILTCICAFSRRKRYYTAF